MNASPQAPDPDDKDRDAGGRSAESAYLHLQRLLERKRARDGDANARRSGIEAPAPPTRKTRTS